MITLYRGEEPRRLLFLVVDVDTQGQPGMDSLEDKLTVTVRDAHGDPYLAEVMPAADLGVKSHGDGWYSMDVPERLYGFRDWSIEIHYDWTPPTSGQPSRWRDLGQTLEPPSVAQPGDPVEPPAYVVTIPEQTFTFPARELDVVAVEPEEPVDPPVDPDPPVEPEPDPALGPDLLADLTPNFHSPSGDQDMIAMDTGLKVWPGTARAQLYWVLPEISQGDYLITLKMVHGHVVRGAQAQVEWNLLEHAAPYASLADPVYLDVVWPGEQPFEGTVYVRGTAERARFRLWLEPVDAANTESYLIEQISLQKILK